MYHIYQNLIHFIISLALSNIYQAHFTKNVRTFADSGGYSLLWPEATQFLSYMGAM